MNRIFTLIFRFLQNKIFSYFSHVGDQVRHDLHWRPFSSSLLYGAQLIFDVEGMHCYGNSAIWFWPREGFFGCTVRAEKCTVQSAKRRSPLIDFHSFASNVRDKIDVLEPGWVRNSNMQFTVRENPEDPGSQVQSMSIILS